MRSSHQVRVRCVVGLAMVFFFVGATQGAEPATASPPRVNLARGAKYTLFPAPNYEHCTDSQDAVQLTDGQSTQDYFWTQKGTVGWSGAAYAVITVDLGAVAPIGGVALTTAAGVAGVTWPASIPILVSDDGSHYRNVGDLTALDRKAHGLPKEGYSIRRLTADLATRGRFVRFVLIPVAGGSFLFVDEVEVHRGPQDLLARDPGGEPVGDPADLFQRSRIDRALALRFTSDVEGLRGLIEKAAGLDAARRIALLAHLEMVRKELESFQPGDRSSFRAVLPVGEHHARLLACQAELWRALGHPPFSAIAAAPWDPLPLITVPATSSGAVEVHSMRGEYRSAAINLANAALQPIEVHLSLEGLPSSRVPDSVRVHEVEWTDTSEGKPVAAALPEAKRSRDGWTLRVLPGMVRQVWLTFHDPDLAPGQYEGRMVCRAEGMGTQAVPIRLRVWPFRFPKQPALGVGGWCYSDGDGTYGVNARNRAAFLQHLRERFVNMPWAGAGVMTSFEFVAAGGSSVKLDTRRFDEWIGRWPDARQYMVFLAVGPEFAGQAAGTPEFGRRVGAWISAWVRHLASKGVEPHRLGLLIHDEPHEATDVSAIVAWARAIRSAEPKVLLWVDPTYEEPRKAPAELFAVHDVLCPNRPMWLAHGAAFRDFYLDQQRQGRRLQFYSCSGPAKLLDPYSYYRLQAWHCFAVGATASSFWAFGDNGGASSWNEYLAKAGPFTPLFLDETTVTAGKHMEAIRESVEDYETLVMLRSAIDRARKTNGGEAADRAEAILRAGVEEVLAAEGASNLTWHLAKDRAKADAVRVRLLEALQTLP